MNGPNGGENAIGLICMLGFIVAILALVITIWWKIWDKTGYGGALSLLMLLPIVNLIMLLVLAFGDWPVQQELRRLRRELGERDEYGGGRRLGGGAPGFLKRDPEAGEETGYRQ
jgi:hypothetical protein